MRSAAFTTAVKFLGLKPELQQSQNRIAILPLVV
jgi:hypothetical protein